MKPSIGHTVHYKLSEADAQDINRRRHDFLAFTRMYTRPEEPGNPGTTGHVGHFGSPVKPGDAFPAMIVRVWAATPSVNLQVHLDGNDTFWATSREKGDGQGEWSWPVKVPELIGIPHSALSSYEHKT
jgi:hypothetical protein